MGGQLHHGICTCAKDSLQLELFHAWCYSLAIFVLEEGLQDQLVWVVGVALHRVVREASTLLVIVVGQLLHITFALVLPHVVVLLLALI